MFKTTLTEALNIEHPIIQGGMMWVSRAPLVSAVSNAGALGILTALSFDTPQKLREEIRKTKGLTDKPFGVNITLLPTLRKINYEGYIDVIIDENIKVVETAGRNPEPYISTLKEHNVKIIHKCTSVKHALKAQSIGCDFVSIDGFECAGHPGEDDICGLVLIPSTVDRLNIPVIASGGIGDGRGFVAALALGACGVNMGTRFMVTKEAPIHENIKRTIVNTRETETLLVERSLKNTMRVLKNRHALKVLDMEKRGATLEELAPLLSGLKGLNALENGNAEDALIACGQVAGIINDIPSVGELINRVITEAMDIVMGKLPGMAAR